MQILPSQGTAPMPPLHNFLKLANKSHTSKAFKATSKASRGSARSSSPPSTYFFPPDRISAAADMVSRCFATPSVHAPVLPYGFQQGSILLESSNGHGSGLRSARAAVTLNLTRPHRMARISMAATARGLLGDPNKRGWDTQGRRETPADPWRRYSDTGKQLQNSYAFHFFQFTASGNPAVADLPIRSFHNARVSKAMAAQPGTVSVGKAEEGFESTEGVDKSLMDHGHLRLHSGACCLPHPDKVKKGGEDAHFISTDLSAIGVADGVGGWADVGVDAGLYARELMTESAKALLDEPQGAVNPRTVLKKAHSLTKSAGSSTACIVVLANDRINAANLGDSGFIIIRNGRTLFKSPPQQHDFNFPFQLGSQGCDAPDLAEEFALPVAAGDILVCGTDGLFDNLFDSELTSVVMHSTKAGWGPQDTAERIATLAHLRAQDPLRQSPFARAAQEAGYRFMGGKMDDITVVVSYVTAKEIH